MSNEITIKDYSRLEISVSPDLTARINNALALSETIFDVTDADSQTKAVAVQAAIKEIISGVGKAREAAKAPVLELGRKIDALAKMTIAELENEHRDRPNAVALEPRIGFLKELYLEGQRNIKGVEFREKIISTTRASKTIDV